MKFIIAIPAYNEEEIIQESLLKLDNFLIRNFPDGEYVIIVSDNNSTDKTKDKVLEASNHVKNLEYHFTPSQGKGIAIKAAWEKHKEEFDVFAFMDADLATGLDALPELLRGAYQAGMCIGDRYHPESTVERAKSREIISRSYRFIIRTLLKSAVSDFPCGFKAINKKTFETLVPKVENMFWFFDSELVYNAEREGMNIIQIPVRWRDPRPKIEQSKVNIPLVSIQYIKEVIRLKKSK